MQLHIQKKASLWSSFFIIKISQIHNHVKFFSAQFLSISKSTSLKNENLTQRPKSECQYKKCNFDINSPNKSSFMYELYLISDYDISSVRDEKSCHSSRRNVLWNRALVIWNIISSLKWRQSRKISTTTSVRCQRSCKISDTHL